jgi:hypothetical protein
MRAKTKTIGDELIYLNIPFIIRIEVLPKYAEIDNVGLFFI